MIFKNTARVYEAKNRPPAELVCGMHLPWQRRTFSNCVLWPRRLFSRAQLQCPFVGKNGKNTHQLTGTKEAELWTFNLSVVGVWEWSWKEDKFSSFCLHWPWNTKKNCQKFDQSCRIFDSAFSCAWTLASSEQASLQVWSLGPRLVMVWWSLLLPLFTCASHVSKQQSIGEKIRRYNVFCQV